MASSSSLLGRLASSLLSPWRSRPLTSLLSARLLPFDSTRHPRQGPKEVAAGPGGTLTGTTQDIFGFVPHFRPTRAKRKYRKKKHGFGPNAFQDKPIQKWEDYDGFGAYQYRHHKFPNNKTLNDLQKRRVFKVHAEERLRINAVRKADILPKEIRRLADQEIQRVPRCSSITVLNRRCTLSGRARGIFHQFRVSRMVWRLEADYNKLSGVQRAKWMYGIHIKP